MQLRVLDPDSAIRSCGDCSLCCRVMVIAELVKPEHVPCSHLRPLGGCSIYGNHPESCKAFKCGWKAGWLPKTLTPNSTHCVILEHQLEVTGQAVVIVLVDNRYPNAWQERRMQEWIYKVAHKFPVMVKSVWKNQPYVVLYGTLDEALLYDQKVQEGKFVEVDIAVTYAITNNPILEGR